MKILLCCKAGVTSNMFASALKDEASKKDMEVIIWATAETMIEYSIEQADVILVTPQLKSSVSKFEDLAKELINILSELDAQKQIEIFEFAQCVYTDKENKWKNWRV